MPHPDNQVWEQIVERIELQVSDADLVNAEAALREVDAEELRPEFIDAVIARAHAESVEAMVEPAPLVAARAPMRLLPRMRKVAAAALAMLWGSKATAATAVVAVLVIGTVLWSGHDSTEMSDQQAMQILIDGDKKEAFEAAALSEIGARVRSVVVTLKQLRDDSATPASLKGTAVSGLAELRTRLGSALPPMPIALDGSVDMRLAIANAINSQMAEPGRVFFAQTAIALAANGLSAMHSFKCQSAQMQADRAAYFRSLGRALR